MFRPTADTVQASQLRIEKWLVPCRTSIYLSPLGKKKPLVVIDSL